MKILHSYVNYATSMLILQIPHKINRESLLTKTLETIAEGFALAQLMQTIAEKYQTSEFGLEILI